MGRTLAEGLRKTVLHTFWVLHFINYNFSVFFKFAFISSSFKNKIEKGNLDVSSNNGRSSVHISDCRI